MRFDRDGQTEWPRVGADGLQAEAIASLDINLVAQRRALALELAARGMGMGKQ